MDELLMTELSAETFAALQAHLLERHQEDENKDTPVSEDFRLSQFWYDEKTGRALAQESIDHSSKELKIAFVSTPAAYRAFLTIQSEEKEDDRIKGDNVYIFEFDRRFGEKYGDRYCFYDYNAPMDLPERFHHFFDYVLMEPPHLSIDCLDKFSDTMRWLAKDVESVPGKKDRVINPATFINSQLLRKEMKANLGFTPTGFYPSFESKLSNHLFTYTNYESERFGPCKEPEDDDEEDDDEEDDDDNK